MNVGVAAMISELELRNEMAKALRGAVSLNDLYAWLMARNRNMHKDSEPAAIELANVVEDLFFDRADGSIDDASVGYSLRQILGVCALPRP